MKNCRNCRQPYSPLPSQIKKWDWECGPCRQESWKRRAARKKAAGKKLSGGRTSPAKAKAWYEASKTMPHVRAMGTSNQRRYRKDPTKRSRYEARWAVNRAIAAGRLVRQPCANCGAAKSQAHHSDYSKPLDVRWLCQPCHMKAHKESKSI